MEVDGNQCADPDLCEVAKVNVEEIAREHGSGAEYDGDEDAKRQTQVGQKGVGHSVHWLASRAVSVLSHMSIPPDTDLGTARCHAVRCGYGPERTGSARD